jgi:hypothetical protein
MTRRAIRFGDVITPNQLMGSIRPLLDDLVRLSDRVRLVGTASSALRGIDLPVGDVDILTKDRETVDELAAAFGSAPATLIETPFGHQYLADHWLEGVLVQLSTVESDVRDRRRLAECVGDAPWCYFSLVDVAGRPVPLVASELRRRRTSCVVATTVGVRSPPTSWRTDSTSSC